MDNITIKPLTKEIIDNSNYRSWFNDPEITEFSSHRSCPLTEEEIQRYLKQANNHNNITWAIFHEKFKETAEDNIYAYHIGNIHIGNIALQEIDFINRSAELAILIGEKDYWRKGIATDVCNLIITHGFENLNLQRIWLGTPELNKGMIAVAKKIGMELEGRLIKAFWYKTKYIDILKYSITLL